MAGIKMIENSQDGVGNRDEIEIPYRFRHLKLRK